MTRLRRRRPPRPDAQPRPDDAAIDSADDAAERWLRALIERGEAASSPELQPQKRGDAPAEVRA